MTNAATLVGKVSSKHYSADESTRTEESHCLRVDLRVPAAGGKTTLCRAWDQGPDALHRYQGLTVGDTLALTGPVEVEEPGLDFDGKPVQLIDPVVVRINQIQQFNIIEVNDLDVPRAPAHLSTHQHQKAPGATNETPLNTQWLQELLHQPFGQTEAGRPYELALRDSLAQIEAKRLMGQGTKGRSEASLWEEAIHLANQRVLNEPAYITNADLRQHQGTELPSPSAAPVQEPPALSI